MGTPPSADISLKHQHKLRRPDRMTAVKPVPADKAPDDIKPIFEGMTKNFGKVPAFFGIMAQKPEVLKTFLPFYGAITGPGALDQRYKELAYLKTSMVNGCVY